MYEDTAKEQDARRFQDPLEVKLRKMLKALPAGQAHIRKDELVISLLDKTAAEATRQDLSRLNGVAATIKGWTSNRVYDRELETYVAVFSRKGSEDADF